MLQKEERILMILLIISLTTLSIAYLFLSGSQSTAYSNSSRTGEKVHISGVVNAKQPTRTGGNLILELNSNSTRIKIFIPENAGAAEVAKKVKIGDRVNVQGTLQEYKGEREIVIRDSNDVVVL